MSLFLRMGFECHVGGFDYASSFDDVDLASARQERLSESGLILETQFSLDNCLGIYKRSDRLINSGKDTIHVERPKAIFYIQSVPLRRLAHAFRARAEIIAN